MPTKAITTRAELEAQHAKEREDLECELEELSIETEHRCEKIISAAEVAATALRSSFSVQLTRLPRAVRSMAVESFLRDFEGSIPAVLAGMDRSVPGTVLKSRAGVGNAPHTVRRGTSKVVPRTVRRGPVGGRALPGMVSATPGRARIRAVAATPGVRAIIAPTPGAKRIPKPGEVLFSANGSPIGSTTVDGAAADGSGESDGVEEKVGKGDAVAAASSSAEVEGEGGGEGAAIEIDVALATGKALRLDPKASGIEELTGDEKLQAREQLAALQAQISSIMSKL